MTDNVKQFIEKNINLLENKKYYNAFTLWYLHYYDAKTDTASLNELFRVFRTAEIDLDKESEEARRQIIKERMLNYIDNVLGFDPDTTFMTLPDVLKNLRSRLDVRLVELNNLFKECYNELSKRYNIELQPFKIVRKK